jgi:hypothetical protein
MSSDPTKDPKKEEGGWGGISGLFNKKKKPASSDEGTIKDLLDQEIEGTSLPGYLDDEGEGSNVPMK